ncbi:MAG: choice-of-anchor D domain-containing protein [Candidatus Acidiferrales bacterium]
MARISAAPSGLRHGLALRFKHAFIALSICALALISPAPTTPQSPAPQFVYTADYSAHNISGFQLNPSTGALSPIPGSPFNERLDPFALAVDPAGRFLFAANTKDNNSGDNDVSVFQINPTTGALTETPNSPFSAGNGAGPTTLATDPLGLFLYVGNTTNNADTSLGEVDVYSINQTTGALTPSIQSQNGGTIGPLGPRDAFVLPASTSATTIYIAGQDPIQIPEIVQPYTINAQTGDLVPGNSFDSLDFIVSFVGDPTGHFLFLSYGQDVGHIETLSPALASLSLFAEPGIDGSNLIGTMAVDSTGRYLFTDQGTFSIAPGTGVLTQINTMQVFPYNSFTADLAGPFLFAADNSNPMIYSFQVDTTTGLLTPAPGSPFTTSAVVQSIAVTGRLQNQSVSFSPSSLTFADQAVNTSTSMPIQLHNTGTSSVSIMAISITGTDMSDFSQTNDCPSALGAQSFCTITVTFMPIAVGQQLSAAVSVMDSAPGSPQAAGLFGAAFVPAPTANLNPSSFTFAQTTVGATSASMGFTLMNSGTATLQIQNLGLGGPNPGDFTESNTCGASVNVNSSCTITVAFRPQAVGQRTATVNIVDNAADSPQMISLTGTGNAPFNLAATTPTSKNAQPGQMVQYGLQFTPNANFTGMVQFACTSSPPGPQCSVSPPSAQVNGPNSMPLMVNATAPMMAAARRAGLLPGARPLSAFRTSSLGLLVLFLAAFVMAGATRPRSAGAANSWLARFSVKQFQLTHAILALALAAILVSAACGGSGGDGTGGGGPQNFTLTVTASSGQSALPITLTLSVQ